MRTNVVLDDALLEQVKEFTGEKTIRGALEAAMSEYVKYRLRLRFLDRTDAVEFWPDYSEDDESPHDNWATG